MVYSDGLVEAVNARGEPFGEARLGDFITAHRDVPAEQFAERLLDEVLGWPENARLPAQADDITLVVMDIGEMPQQAPGCGVSFRSMKAGL